MFAIFTLVMGIDISSTTVGLLCSVHSSCNSLCILIDGRHSTCSGSKNFSSIRLTSQGDAFRALPFGFSLIPDRLSSGMLIGAPQSCP